MGGHEVAESLQEFGGLCQLPEPPVRVSPLCVQGQLPLSVNTGSQGGGGP